MVARQQWHTLQRDTEVEKVAIKFCGDAAVAVPLHSTISIAAAKAHGILRNNKQLVIVKRLRTQLIAHTKKLSATAA
jgi:hypothetical protein